MERCGQPRTAMTTPTNPTPPVPQEVRGAIHNAAADIHQFADSLTYEQIRDRILSAIAPHVTQPAPTAPQESPHAAPTLPATEKSSGEGVMSPREIAGAYGGAYTAFDVEGCATAIQNLVDDALFFTKRELAASNAALAACREELAEVQRRKIEACIAWTEAQDKLSTAERERDEARRELQQANKTCAELVTDSNTITLAKNLADKSEEAAYFRGQLDRICKEGFDYDHTISEEPYADYLLRQVTNLRQQLALWQQAVAHKEEGNI